MYWNIVESVLTNNEFEESQSYTAFIVVTKDIMVILDLKMIFLRCKTRSSTWLDVKICAKYTYNAVPAIFFFFSSILCQYGTSNTRVSTAWKISTTSKVYDEIV